jgi:hypothetical protein
VDRAGPVSHGPSVDGRLELTGAWPPAAPVLTGASQGAEDGMTGSGNPLRASPEGGRWQGGRATEGTAAAVSVLIRGSFELRGGAVLSGVLLMAFIGQGRELMRWVTAGNG